jgi:hypothetical protein
VVGVNVAPLAALAGLIASAAIFSPWFLIAYWAYLAFLVWLDNG